MSTANDSASDKQPKKRKATEFDEALGVFFTGGPEFLGKMSIVAGLIFFGVIALVILATGGIAYLVYMIFFAKDEHVWENGIFAGCKRILYLWCRGLVRATFTVLDCCTFGFTRWWLTRWLKKRRAERQRLKIPNVHV